MKQKLSGLVVATVAMCLLLSSAVGADTLPLRPAVMTTAANGNLTNHCTHNNLPCSNGSHTNNYWAIDLFDSQDPSPIYATANGYVKTIDGCGTALRIGLNQTGYGFGYLYCHGKNRQFGVGNWVPVGARVMDMSNTGANNKHLHFEIRWMENVGTWSNNFWGMCSNRYLVTLRDLGYVYLESAWHEPTNAYYSACNW